MLLIKLVLKGIVFMKETGELSLLCFIGSLGLMEV